MTRKTATLIIKQWGNSLALRLPTAISRAAKLSLGQQVELSEQDGCILIKPIGTPKLTLNQKLAAFDPQKHASPEVLK